jgi:hypothetical protein
MEGRRLSYEPSAGAYVDYVKKLKAFVNRSVCILASPRGFQRRRMRPAEQPMKYARIMIIQVEFKKHARMPVLFQLLEICTGKRSLHHAKGHLKHLAVKNEGWQTLFI